jgi:hypothetical protein
MIASNNRSQQNKSINFDQTIGLYSNFIFRFYRPGPIGGHLIRFYRPGSIGGHLTITR